MRFTRSTVTLFAISAITILAGIGCGDDPIKPTGKTGPDNPVPANRATDIPTTTTFEWSYADSTADSLFYDFYLGFSDPLPLLASRIIDTCCTILGTMVSDTTYFWKVIAYDTDDDSISSSTWRFTTEKAVRFPIMPGNTWEYVKKYYSFNFDPPELRDSLPHADTIFGATATTIMDTATIADTILTFLFHTEWTEDGNSGSGDEFFNNADSGFYLYAFSGGGVEPPKIDAAPGIYLEFKGMRFVNLDEIYATFKNARSEAKQFVNPSEIEDPPIREIPYPVEIGREWIYRSTDWGHVWNMEKHIIDTESVAVPAGQFGSYVLRWFWDLNGDGEWDTDIDGYDYIASVGTVKRVFYFYDIVVTNYALDTLGTFDAATEYELAEFDSP